MGDTEDFSDDTKDELEDVFHSQEAGTLTDSALQRRVGIDSTTPSRVRLDRERITDVTLLTQRLDTARITHVYLQHNLLRSLQPLMELPRLKFATVSHNQITDAALEGLESMQSLIFLDLSSNCIEHLDQLVYHLPEKYGHIIDNPAVVGSEETARAALIALLPRLRAVDGEKITPDERVRSREKMGVDATFEEEEKPDGSRAHVYTSTPVAQNSDSAETRTSSTKDKDTKQDEERKAEEDKKVLQSLLPSLIDRNNPIPQAQKEQLSSNVMTDEGSLASARSKERHTALEQKAEMEDERIHQIRNESSLKPVTQLSQQTPADAIDDSTEV